MELYDLSLAILKLVSLLVGLKLIQWNIRYFYRVWVYSHLDGPRIIPYLGNFLSLDAQHSKIFKNYIDMTMRYRNTKFFRFWIGTQSIVIFHKCDALEAVFNNPKFMDKPFEYSLTEPWLKTGLLTGGGDKWAHRRKLITPSFHFDILKDFLAVINEQSEIFIEILKKVNKDEMIVLIPYISACSLDIICETAMGVNVNAQGDANTSYVKAVHRYLEVLFEMCSLLTERMRLPYLWPEFLFKLSKCHQDQTECLKILQGFTRKIIKEREEEFTGLSGVNIKRVAFLDTLLDARLKNPDSIDLDGIQEEVDTFMFEGHDTTSSALDFACFAIATHPEEQAKLHKEIDSVFGDSNRSVTESDLSKLTYLECAIKESLRLYPPVSYFGRNVKEDANINGHQILKGSTLGISSYMIHRDEKYYPQAEEYRPQRFLPENSENRHPFAFIPFSAGRRNCVGQRFAMLELKVMLANILRNFKMECSQTYEELKPYSYIILRTEVPIMIKLSEREKL